MIYRFRAILDAEEDIFRDLEISGDATLEDLHDVISQSFGLEGQEMASFYLSNEEWHQGEEISLFDMSESSKPVRTMQDTLIKDVASKEQTRFIYLYDFLNMWTFLVELADMVEPEPGASYPNLMFAHGTLPPLAPERGFQAGESLEEEDDLDADFNDDYDIEDLDNLDFDENWN
ncbi:IS1096 element passenger TnpR family protein [Croceiramulus getboli]|nr:hypothetical protein P8624_11110 [Flavobacteriaceae bacterium YJPT1-3]